MYIYNGLLTDKNVVYILIMLPLFSEEKVLIFEQMLDSVSWNTCVKSGCQPYHEALVH